ncbi:hypothetical protein PJM29_30785, partial [Mycobacterium kansasii]
MSLPLAKLLKTKTENDRIRKENREKKYLKLSAFSSVRNIGGKYTLKNKLYKRKHTNVKSDVISLK